MSRNEKATYDQFTSKSNQLHVTVVGCDSREEVIITPPSLIGEILQDQN